MGKKLQGKTGTIREMEEERAGLLLELARSHQTLRFDGSEVRLQSAMCLSQTARNRLKKTRATKKGGVRTNWNF